LVLAFAGLTIARIVHRPVPDADEGRCFRWLRAHWGIVIATMALWGGEFCWVLLEPAFGGEARTVALLSTTGLVTAVADVFSMRRGFALARSAPSTCRDWWRCGAPLPTTPLQWSCRSTSSM
jgi:hypothetical protein